MKTQKQTNTDHTVASAGNALLYPGIALTANAWQFRLNENGLKQFLRTEKLFPILREYLKIKSRSKQNLKLPPISIGILHLKHSVETSLDTVKEKCR